MDGRLDKDQRRDDKKLCLRLFVEDLFIITVNSYKHNQ